MILNMISRIFAVTLLLLSLSPITAQACPTGNAASLAYIRRDNNRCEGLTDELISDTFSLVSFLTTSLTDYSNTLVIRIPGTGNTRPAITLQSPYRNYLLDNLNIASSTSGYTFSLNTQPVLRKAEIPFTSLQATAYITRDSSPVYFPVILGNASDAYQFTINSPQRTSFPVLEIRRDGQTVFSNPLATPRQGIIRFSWSYGNASAGTYELYLEDSNGDTRTFRFEHNPNWL